MPAVIGTSRMSSSTQAVGPSLYRIPTGLSNAYFVAIDAEQYVIVDAGGTGYGKRILKNVMDFFNGRAPLAILLTHAHFDHAGGVPELLKTWPGLPVYAHPLEFPYLRRHDPRKYPQGDPTVGGVMANFARMLDISKPTPIDAELRPLPETRGALEIMPGWECIPTPGHTPGHVSFWNQQRRLLIAGDALITMNMNNPRKALAQTPELAGPPPYATYNWIQAERSAHVLADLEPYYLCSGHGVPMQGPEIAEMLEEFVRYFPVPRRGRYVMEPARFNRSGPVYVPPARADWTKRAFVATGAAVLAFGLYSAAKRSHFA